MTEEGFKRKLTTIFSADVEGYSRLMSEDEAQTVKTLTAYREIMAELIKQHRGRVIDSPGDNLLAEFSSVVDAVQCAVAVQKELQARNAELPEERRMEFRIGVNLGDVIEEGDRIYGDGVNIAARLESLADPGGICISKTAFDHIETKLPLGYEYLGEQTVKNIPKPVGAYRVFMEPRVTVAGKVEKEKAVPVWRRKSIFAGAIAVIVAAIAVAIWNFYLRPPPIERASVERMAHPLPEEPSIAVLPFTNLSGDPEQEYFSDGITEHIITSLSKVPYIFVIARNSTFTYKGNPVKVQRVAEELGVRYVLEGSVQRSDDRVRITVQLIDAITGHHLWAENYDRKLTDIFALQDEIAMKIMGELQVKLTVPVLGRLSSIKTTNLKAYEKFLKGVEHIHRRTEADVLEARRLAREAIALDPEYGAAYLLLGYTHLDDVWFYRTKDRAKSLQTAEQLAQKVIDLSGQDADTHRLFSYVYLLRKQYEKAVAEAQKAVELNPNCASSNFVYGMVLGGAERYDEAIPVFKKAIRLNPFTPIHYLNNLAWAYTFSEQYEKAIPLWNRTIERNPDYLFAYQGLTCAYQLSGNEIKAREAAAEVLRIKPTFSIALIEKGMVGKNEEIKKRLLEAYRKAGLPEHPPLPLPDKPSIAVLPFVNMSGDPEQEYFSDGMSEEIITALSKVPHLFVIARNSSFSYKGKPVKIQQVGRELGVRYVLEGSVRKSKDRVRITAQLVDTTTGNHLWAQRYDRDLKDIFALQDEITMKIITALQVTLTEGEQSRVLGKGTDNLEAYVKLLQAREHFFRMNKQGSMRARQLAMGAISLDPEYAGPYVILALTHMMDLWFEFSESPKESMKLAVEAAQKALTLDDSYPGTYVGMCMLYIMQRQHDKAIAAGERAVALSPSGANAHHSLGTALKFAGRPNEAIPFIKKAISLNPFPPSIYLSNLGTAYRMAGRNEEAVVEYKKSVRINPNDLFTHLGLAVAYISLGREEEARAEAAEVLRIHPKFSLEHYAKTLPLKNQADVDYEISSLSKAGLK